MFSFKDTSGALNFLLLLSIYPLKKMDMSHYTVKVSVYFTNFPSLILIIVIVYVMILFIRCNNAIKIWLKFE